jgi:hypothetical protein
MLGNPEYNAAAYDVTCRVPGCPFHFENLSPTLVAVNLLPHIKEHRPVGGPVYALRVAKGYEGLDPENPVRTPEDGWNRSPTLQEDHDRVRA